MLAAYFFGDPLPIDRIAEMIVALEHRSSPHLHKAGVVQWIEPAESPGDVTLRRGDTLAQLHDAEAFCAAF